MNVNFSSPTTFSRGVSLGGGLGRQRRIQDQGYVPIRLSGKVPADLTQPGLTGHVAAALFTLTPKFTNPSLIILTRNFPSILQCIA